jgi:hypothetical protein
VWAFFVALILLVPVLAWLGYFFGACLAAAAVMVEGLVLVVNRGRCPLTDVAARYTDNRAPNFDIYLPVWVAKNNKQIFTPLYLIGVAVAASFWLSR